MSLIKSIHGTELTEYVIKLLNKNKIMTVIDFLQEDVTKMSKFINLSISEINVLKNILIKEYCPNLECAYNKYEKLINYTPFITGIESLDIMLNGELICGSLVEICGLPATGKSFFCSTIALNLAQNLHYGSLFIDTKKDFSSTRMTKFIMSRGCSEMEISSILQKIRVERIYDACNVVQALKELYKNERVLKNLKLIVIDSLPSVWFQYHGQKSVDGISLLVETTNLLRKLSKEFGILVIVVNIVTRWIQLELEENISEKSQTTIKPSLGKYWETVPDLRLIIEFLPNCKKSTTQTTSYDDTSHESQRFIKILKSNCYETGKSCTVNLTDKGIL